MQTGKTELSTVLLESEVPEKSLPYIFFPQMIFQVIQGINLYY